MRQHYRLGIMLCGGALLLQATCTNVATQFGTGFLPSFTIAYFSTLINFYVPQLFGITPATSTQTGTTVQTTTPTVSTTPQTTVEITTPTVITTGT